MKKDECHKMVRTWELVRQIIQSINISRLTVIKLYGKCTRRSHVVTETRMAVGEEVIEEWEQWFEIEK